MADLVPWFAPAFAVYRQVQYWFGIDSGYEELAQLPIYIWMHSTLPGEYFYGFPAVNGRWGGVKVATEEFVTTTTADDVDRFVTDAETSSMYEGCVRGRLRGVGSTTVRRLSCLYTVTPDFGFLVDVHPGLDRVFVVSACSGHGFKHSAAVGEAAARWVTSGRRPAALDSFSFGRF
jgi:sarcosine oxidase